MCQFETDSVADALSSTLETLASANGFVKECHLASESPAKDKPVLLMVYGPLRGQQWVMHGDQLVIGRGSECDIVIPERRVSRQHVRIWREGNRYYVADLDSKNGSHLNGAKLQGSLELTEGDEIQVALFATLKFIGTEATTPLIVDESEIGSERGLRLDSHTREVYVNGRRLDPQLSLYQFRLLELLFASHGGVCTRDEVVRHVWPEVVEEGISEQAIDALVRRLRDRLAELEPDHQFIATVRGHGFRLSQPSEAT